VNEISALGAADQSKSVIQIGIAFAADRPHPAMFTNILIGDHSIVQTNTNRVLPIRALFALDQYPEERFVLADADAAERPGFTHFIDHADCAPKLNEKMGLHGGPRTSGSSEPLGAAGGSRGGP
jgi:hypothetical protein